MSPPNPSYLYPIRLTRINNNTYTYDDMTIIVKVFNRTASNGSNYMLYEVTVIDINRRIKEAYNIADQVIRRVFPNITLFVNQIIAKGNNKFYSKDNLINLIEEIDKESNTYESNMFNIEDLIINYSIYEDILPKIEHKNQVANGSDRYVYMYKDYFIATLIDIKDVCISLAYNTWQLYIKGNRDIINSKILRKMTYLSNIKSMQDLPCSYKTIIAENELDNIRPIDTIKSLYMLYRREHVHVIMHKNFLSDSISSYLKWMSRPQYLSIIKGSKLKTSITKDIHVMDLECVREYNDNNNTIRHIPYCLSYSIYDNVGTIVGLDCIEQLFNSLNNIGHDLIIWMHYGGKYDTQLILDKVLNIVDTKYINPIEILDTHQKIISMDIKMSNCTITLRDSHAILPSSLKRLCKSFKVDNPKIDIDSTKFTYASFSDPNVLKYATTDSIALKQILRKYSDKCLSNNLPNPLNFATLTSMCKNILYSTYYKPENYICELNIPAYNYIRKSYKGGYVRCFKPGIYKNLRTYDIKSSYPYAGTKLVPTGGFRYSNNYRELNSEQDLWSCLFFAECLVIPNFSLKYKIRPHMYSNSEGLDIDDEREGCKYQQFLFSEEIRLGLKHGYKYIVYSMIGFGNSTPFMREFNTDTYKYKLDAEVNKDHVMRLVYKLIANSCYGYLGYNKYNKPVIRIYSNNDINLQRCRALEESNEGTYIVLGQVIYCIQYIDINIKKTNVAIASAITSYARIRLFEIGKYIEDNGYEVYYCDTDSIKTNMMIQPNHEYFGKDLGQMDMEFSHLDPVETCLYAKKLLTTIYWNPIKNKYKYIITSKGIDTNKTYTNEKDIYFLTKEDKASLIQVLKYNYLNGHDVDIIQGRINVARSNRIKGKLGLYETSYIKHIKLN